MAKKKAQKKSTRKVVKKAAKKVKKTAKKAVKKVAKKAIKKTAKKVVKKATKKAEKKTVKKAVVKTAKKASAKKVAVKNKASKPGKKVKKLSLKDIEHFHKLLLKKRAQILGDVNSMENEALRKHENGAGGEISNMPIHMADVGTDNYEQEFALGLLDSERKIIKEIDAALGRITEGNYGICEGTGKAISKQRLEANPWARYCIEYAVMVEKGLVIEGEKVDDYHDDEDDFYDEDYLAEGDFEDDDFDSYDDPADNEKRMLYE